MKILLLTTLVLAGLFCGVVAAEKEQPARTGKLNHVVAFKFKSSASPEQIKGLIDAFKVLPKKISEVSHFEWGTNISPEKFDKGFTHGFVLTFKSTKDRDAYLVHPAHKEFVDLALPLVEDVFVIDFWAET